MQQNMTLPCGAIWSDSRDLVDCPKCGAKAGDYCRQPKGRKQWPPHGERVQQLRTKRPDAIMAARIPKCVG